MGRSGNHSSALRKRALRKLAREQHEAYRAHYAVIAPNVDNRYQIRGQALTQLRHQFPDRYLELYAIERAAPGTEIPASIRSKSWQRAVSILAHVKEPIYRKRLEQFQAKGYNGSAAFNAAMASLRADEPELFTEILARELSMWLSMEHTAWEKRS